MKNTKLSKLASMEMGKFNHFYNKGYINGGFETAALILSAFHRCGNAKEQKYAMWIYSNYSFIQKHITFVNGCMVAN